MTTVNIDINRLTATGHVSATATVRVTYVRGAATPVLVDGAAVTYPDRIEQEITGTAAMEVYETGPSMAAHWLITFPTGARLERVTAIPASGTIDFGDLADIDPASVTPTLDVLHAWEAIVGEVAGYTDTTLTARDDAVTAAGSADVATAAAAASASSAAGSASAAGTSAGNAATAAAAAQTARTGAETARTAAETAANVAAAGQFAGSSLGNVSLDTITTPGKYNQLNGANTTLENGYPFTGRAAALEVFNGPNSARMQQIRALPLGTTTTSRVFYERTLNGSGWGAWRAFVSLSIDQTAGRVIRAWDDINGREQNIWGDTGWRDVSADLLNGWTGSLFIRRVGSQVEARAINLVPGTATTFYTFPSGFRPGGPASVAISARPSSGGTPVYGSISAAGTAQLLLTALASVPGSWSFLTDNAWPTILPGAVSGTIPNA